MSTGLLEFVEIPSVRDFQVGFLGDREQCLIQCQNYLQVAEIPQRKSPGLYFANAKWNFPQGSI